MRRRIFSKILDENHVGDLAYVPECYLPQITNGPNYPTWSPDGTELAFAMEGSIWRLKVGEDIAHELTSDASYDSQPAWSPDGRWVVYTSELDERIHLKLLNLQTGSVRALTSGNSINVEPTWSPDGKRLAYVSTAPEGTFKIYTLRFENGNTEKPQLLTPAYRFSTPTVYYGDMAHYINPVWTADSKDLIFISNHDNKNGSGGFYRMKAEPGVPMKRFYYEETTWKARPSISPDGAKMVYSSYLGRQWQQLWIMPSEGGDAFPLTYGDFDRTVPKWSPDGSRIAFMSNQTGDTTLWLFHSFAGKLEQIRIDRLDYKRPVGKLAVRVLDSTTGRPISARVHLDAADGRAYAPRDSWLRADFFVEDHLEKQQYQYFYSQGEFTMQLPVGNVSLTVSHGLQYVPKQASVTVSADHPQTLTIRLDRLDDIHAKGWWSADNHFHMNYAGVYHTTPVALMQQGDSEDIDVLNNLICNKEQRIPDVSFFTGKPDPLSTNRRILYHNQEYHPPFWGHAVFLNLTQHLIIPAYVGYANTAVESIYPPNTIPFRVARDEDALTGYAHEPGANFPVDLALGTVDFVEANWPDTMTTLYHAWNCGYRIVASAGVDTFTDFYRSNVLGTNRVYVKAGPALEYENWLASFRAGRSFVTAGPLIFLEVNGKEPGDEIHTNMGNHVVTAEVTVESISPIISIELLYKGNVVATLNPTGGALKARLEKALTINQSGWFAARAVAQPIRTIRKPLPWAATMPVWVIVGNEPVRSRASAQYFINFLDRSLARALGGELNEQEKIQREVAETALGAPRSSAPLWNNDLEKDKVKRLYSQARELLMKRRDEAHE